jgi:hypothetical protein
MLKSSFINVGLLVRRLDVLLQQTGRLPLGFEQTALPDEDWLLRLVRFIDRTNILGAYRRAVRNSQPPDIPASQM